jgi:hypothetical protein
MVRSGPQAMIRPARTRPHCRTGEDAFITRWFERSVRSFADPTADGASGIQRSKTAERILGPTR